MPLIETAKRLGLEILNLVFPVSCLICGTDGTYLCPVCLAKLPRLEKQICIACYKPTPYGKTHPDCVTRNTVDGAIAGLSYRSPEIKKIIEVFKYNFVSDLSPQLSQTIIDGLRAQGLQSYFQDFVIVPVPLHPRRANWRGFNQSELLAKQLAAELGVGLDRAMVARNKFTKPQARLSRTERKLNIENAFHLNAPVAGKKILLVDDVVTSGFTANEIAKLLKNGKAREVWIAAAAHG